MAFPLSRPRRMRHDEFSRRLMRETVLGETPARRATSINVDGPEEGEVSGNVQSLTKYYEILFSEDYHI